MYFIVFFIKMIISNSNTNMKQSCVVFMVAESVEGMLRRKIGVPVLSCFHVPGQIELTGCCVLLFHLPFLFTLTLVVLYLSRGSLCHHHVFLLFLRRVLSIRQTTELSMCCRPFGLENKCVDILVLLALTSNSTMVFLYYFNSTSNTCG